MQVLGPPPHAVWELNTRIAPALQVVRQVKKGVAADVPPLGRIILQTGTQDSSKFQEAVAEALAFQLQACSAHL